MRCTRLEREGRLLDIYGRPLDLNNILGGIQRNAAGNITFASTLRISFALINRQYEGTPIVPHPHTANCTRIVQLTKINAHT